MNGITEKQIKVEIKKLLKFIEKINVIMDKNGYYEQSNADLAQGLMKKNGLYVLRKTFEYRRIFDHFENIILKTYIDLSKYILTRLSSPFLIFTNRTLLDIGVVYVDILFSHDVSESNKRRWKLVSCLTDLISSKDPEHIKKYEKLFNEEKDVLTPEEQKYFQDILTKMKTAYQYLLYELTMNARRKLTGINSELHKKYKRSLYITPEIDIYESNLSHLLHGNYMLNKYARDVSRKESIKWATLHIIISTCMNVAYRLVNYINNAETLKEFGNIKKEYDEFMPRFKDYGREKFIKKNSTK